MKRIDREVAERWLARLWNDWTLAEHVALGAIIDALSKVRDRWLRQTLPIWMDQTGGLMITHTICRLAMWEAEERGLKGVLK